MSLTVVNRNRVSPVLPADKCIIGKYYRRQSQPSKLYICARNNDRPPHNSWLISLFNGCPVTVATAADFIEVDLEVTVTDVVQARK